MPRAAPAPKPSNADADKAEREKVERERARLRNQTFKGMQDAAIGFAECDHDGDQKLDFEEFYAMQPRKVRDTRSGAEIRQWFEAADVNGDGELSLDEFFLFSMSKTACEFGATSLIAAFERFDADGTGMLNATEFSNACRQMGYGNAAHSIFRALDTDRSGIVSYRELAGALEGKYAKAKAGVATGATPRLTKTDMDMQAVFQAMLWSNEESKKGPLDTSGWRLRGSTVGEVRENLHKLLKESGAYVSDILALFDQVRGNSTHAAPLHERLTPFLTQT